MQSSWTQVFTAGFGQDYGHDQAVALAGFQGQLHLAIGRPSPEIIGVSTPAAKIYCRTENGCKSWTAVTPPWPTSAKPDQVLMAEFGGHLYVATDDGAVWRCTSNHNWSQVASSLGHTIAGFVVFGQHLYASTYGDREIWRTDDGTVWKRVVGTSAPHPKGFGDPQNGTIGILGVLGKHLYACAGRNLGKGIEIWRTDNGTQWTQFHSLLPDPKVNVGAFPGSVSALAEFNGRLYIAATPGDTLYRTDGSTATAAHWEKLTPLGAGGDIRHLADYDNALYAGVALTSGLGTKKPLLYASSDGSQWSPIQACPLTGGPTTSRITALHSHGKRLYVGGDNLNSSGTLVLWECGPAILADKYEPNGTFADATPVKLAATSTSISVELADLTLHVAAEEDYFRIEYQSDTAKECPAQGSSQVGGGSGSSVVVHPASLSIVATEIDQCQALRLDLYDHQRNPLPQLSGSKSLYITCPTAALNNHKTCYLRVRRAQGQPALRYKLKVTFANSYTEIVLPKQFYKFWEYLPPPYPPPPFVKLFDPAQRWFDLSQFVDELDELMSGFQQYRAQLGRAELRHGLGQLALLAGRYEDAGAYLQHSLEAFQEMGIPVREAEVARHLGDCLSRQGRSAEAMAHFERAVALHHELDQPLGLARDRLSLGRHLLGQGAYREALAALGEASMLLVHNGEASDQGACLLYECDGFAGLDQPEAAVACLLLAEGLSAGGQAPALQLQLAQRAETLTAKWGDEAYVALQARVGDEAETVRRQAYVRLFGE